MTLCAKMTKALQVGRLIAKTSWEYAVKAFRRRNLSTDLRRRELGTRVQEVIDLLTDADHVVRDKVELTETEVLFEKTGGTPAMPCREVYETKPPFAARQRELLAADVAKGQSLIQRNENGQYVRVSSGGEEELAVDESAERHTA